MIPRQPSRIEQAEQAFRLWRLIPDRSEPVLPPCGSEAIGALRALEFGCVDWFMYEPDATPKQPKIELTDEGKSA